MSKPYDSVFKDLLERDPGGWVSLALGAVEGEARLVDSDISTVSGAADKVVLLAGPAPFVIHFEAFASWDPSILARAMNYNGAHHRRHLLPVYTVLVVLQPRADHASLTGEYRVVTPVNQQVHLLQYQVLRAWELDLDTVLQGSLATLPLAPLSDAARSQLPEVLRQMETRLAAEASPEERKDLWTDTFVLMGLRYPRKSVAQLFRGIPAMRESDTYQAILEEGFERGVERGRDEGRDEGMILGARRLLLTVGTPRFGEPDAATRQRIEAETSFARLEEWLSHTGSAEAWSDLPGLQP
jgi:predicted transposase YdaD